eukprot:1140545-Pelagomonas_calceolata.AAC.1
MQTILFFPLYSFHNLLPICGLQEAMSMERKRRRKGSGLELQRKESTRARRRGRCVRLRGRDAYWCAAEEGGRRCKT